MAEQLDHLCELESSGAASIRCIPFSAGVHRGGLGDFTILRFDRSIGAPPILYPESYDGSAYNSEPSMLTAMEARASDLQGCSIAIKEFRS